MSNLKCNPYLTTQNRAQKMDHIRLNFQMHKTLLIISAIIILI